MWYSQQLPKKLMYFLPGHVTRKQSTRRRDKKAKQRGLTNEKRARTNAKPYQPKTRRTTMNEEKYNLNEYGIKHLIKALDNCSAEAQEEVREELSKLVNSKILD